MEEFLISSGIIDFIVQVKSIQTIAAKTYSIKTDLI